MVTSKELKFVDKGAFLVAGLRYEGKQDMILYLYFPVKPKGKK